MMASSSHPQHEADEKKERPRSFLSYNRQSYPPLMEDVVIPAHLLRATGNLGSVRDNDRDLAWEPQQPLMADEEKGLVGRKESLIRRESLARRLSRQSTNRPDRSGSRKLNDSQRSGRRSVIFDATLQQQKSTSPIRNDDAAVRRRSQRLSWMPGKEDVLTISQPNSAMEPALRIPGRVATDNHIDSRHSDNSSNSSIWSNDDPFATRPSSVVDGSEKSYKEPEHVYTPAGQRQRRGTFGSIVDAVVPEGLSKKMTNVSFNGLQRKGSVWKTYENARKRGAELQRKKWVEIVFEYGFYLLLLCLIYFVLIGRPLWNGAVWWLYWVVENKFVFAGGFSITLGIAVL